MEHLPTAQTLAQLSKLWDIHDLVFVRKMENIVYSGVKDGKPAYLRLTLPTRGSKDRIVSELDWLSHLLQFNLPIVQPLISPSGDTILTIEDPEGSYTSCFAGMPGTRATQAVAENPKFLRQVGRLIAQLHLASASYEPSTHVTRRAEWDQERGIQHALDQLEYTQQAHLKSQFQKLITELHSHPRNSQTYGLIHADIGLGNLLVTDDGNIHLIDFDDACYHWFVFDLAVTMTSIVGRFSEKILHGLLAGYQELRCLSDAELQAIPTIQEFMLLRLFFWIEYHQRLGTFHESQQVKVNELRMQIANIFDKKRAPSE